MANTTCNNSQPVSPGAGDLVITRRPLRYRPAFDPEADTARWWWHPRYRRQPRQGQRRYVLTLVVQQVCRRSGSGGDRRTVAVETAGAETGAARGGERDDIFQAQRRVIIQCQAQADY
jgi:hypothetical protein